MLYTDHSAEYSDAWVDEIPGSVKTIAMVGASGDETKPGNHVLRFLTDAGYELIRVNPRPDLTEIRGLKVYPSLQPIDRPIDMVDVFRPSEELAGIASHAVETGARVRWAQLGVHNDEAARIAEAGGLEVVMDRCPKIELLRASREADPDRRTRPIEGSGANLVHAAIGFSRPGGPLNTACQLVGALPARARETIRYE